MNFQEKLRVQWATLHLHYIHTFNPSAASPTDFVPASLAPSVIMTRNFFLPLGAHILQKNLFAASFKARSIRVVPMMS